MPPQFEKIVLHTDIGLIQHPHPDFVHVALRLGCGPCAARLTLKSIGKGLAGKLIRRVMADQVARGERPYLHSYAGNASAIGLYESLGFRPVRAMVATMLARG